MTREGSKASAVLLFYGSTNGDFVVKIYFRGFLNDGYVTWTS